MKKAFVLVLAVLITAAWAAPSLAGEAARFSYGGFMRFRYVGGNPGTIPGPETLNVSDIGGLLEDDSLNEWPYRWRQFFDFRPNEHVRTNIAFEVNSEFGAENQLAGGSGDLQVPTETQFRIKRAFLQFDVPGAPVTLVVGQQSFVSPNSFVNDEDGTGVKVQFKALGGQHTLFWARPLEGGDFQAGSDDADWFGVESRLQIGDFTVRPHLSYLVVGNGVTRGGFQNADVFFAEVVVDGKAGPAGVRLNFAVTTGENEGNPDDVGGCTPAPTTCDLFSYIVNPVVTLEVGPGSLLLQAFYSPGDDNPDDADLDAWQPILTPLAAFTSFFFDAAPGGRAGDIDGISTAMGADASGVLGAGAEFTFKPAKDLAVTPTLYYLQAAEDRIAPGEPSNGEDFYGWETGVHAVWKIWDAVEFYALFDYIFVGDYFKNAAGQTKDAWRVVIGPNISW